MVRENSEAIAVLATGCARPRNYLNVSRETLSDSLNGNTKARGRHVNE
mgnify:CR=1 FL=1